MDFALNYSSPLSSSQQYEIKNIAGKCQMLMHDINWIFVCHKMRHNGIINFKAAQHKKNVKTMFRHKIIGDYCNERSSFNSAPCIMYEKLIVKK